MLTIQTTPEVLFLRVRTPHEKLFRLSSLVQDHFYKRQRILLHVPSQPAADYLSRMLWHLPQESFIPHTYVEEKSDVAVAISSRQGNWNQADILFHLCPAACKQVTDYSIVYDLCDETSGTKLQLARQRRGAYERQGYGICLL